MRVKLHGLQPNQDYAIQLRVSDGESVSPWSRNFEIATIPDPTIPAQPGSLSFVQQGTAFLAKWNDVVTNADGSTIKDFSYYEVSITSGATTVVYKIKHRRYEFSLEDNIAAFGSPQGSLTCSVRAVDAFGNGGTPSSATANNVAPSAPTGLTAQAGFKNVTLAWSPVSDKDLAKYNVYMNSTLIDSISGTSISVPITTVGVQSFAVTAVDAFGVESSPATVSSGPITAISSTADAVDDDGDDMPGVPAWSIDLAGDAQFGNVLVKGSIVVGDSDPTTVSKVQSYDYESGVSGWIIRSDGSAEFLNVAALDISNIEGITADNLAADLIISSSIATAPAGTRRVALDTNGLKVYADGVNGIDGPILVNLPTCITDSPYFSGDINAGSLSVDGGLTIRSDNNVLDRAAVLTLSNGETKPTTAPQAEPYYGTTYLIPADSVSNDWSYVHIPNTTPEEIYLLKTSPRSNQIWQATPDGLGGYTLALSAALGDGDFKAHSFIQLNGNWYVLGQVLPPGAPSMWVVRIFDSSGTWLDVQDITPQIGPVENISGRVAMACANPTASTFWIAFINKTTPKIQFVEFNVGHFFTVNRSFTGDVTHYGGVIGLQVDLTSPLEDLTNRLFVGVNDGNVYVYDKTTGLENTDESWPLCPGVFNRMTAPIMHNPVHLFTSLDPMSGFEATYSSEMWTDPANDTWNFGYIYIDVIGSTNTYFSEMSDSLRYSYPKRSMVQVTGYLPPDDGSGYSPNRLRFFYQRGTDPWRQMGSFDLPQWTLTTITGTNGLSHTESAPPTPNYNSVVSPSTIQSASGGFELKGDGTGTWPTLETLMDTKDSAVLAAAEAYTDAHSGSGSVPSTRMIATGTGLLGGGDLSADRTLTPDFGSVAGKVTQGNDPRLSDSRTPTGAAGGSLSGTYPNPTIATGVITDIQVADANKDGAAGTASMRTLGTGAQQAAAGNDSRLSNSRAPTGPATGSLSGTYPAPGIAALAVGTTQLAGLSVTAAKIANATITDVQVAAANKDGLATVASLRTLGTGAQQAAAGNDSRLSDSRTPTGAAGGSLSGTYPNPAIATGVITDTNVAAANKDGAAGTASMRTLGTGAQQAAAGNDARLSDARTPTGAAGGSLAGTYPNPTIGTGVITDANVAAPNKDGAAGTPSMRTLGTAATQAAAGNDSRLSDSRIPTGSAGGDLGGTYPNPTLTNSPTARSNLGLGDIATHSVSEFDAAGAAASALTSANIYTDGKAAIGAWQTPTFQNSWVAVSEQVAYRTENGGKTVRMVGRIKSGASGTVAMTLPAGYRPNARTDIAVATDGSATAGFVYIKAGGDVTITMPAGATWVNLAGVTFSTT